MSIEKIYLRKLLRLFYAKPNFRRRLLLDEIRNDINKENDEETGGGDFHAPFWADAKDHIAGKLDLREQTKDRIAKNERRKRLYPLLAKGFLSVWEEKIRWRNEPYEFHPATAKGQLSLDDFGAIVKVENVLSIKIWDGTNRLVYPYFAEDPILAIEAARLGLWALHEALPEFSADEVRMMDVLRGTYFRPADAPLQGNERTIFVQKYDSVLTEWQKLRDEQ
jgi:hypothetical protein